MRMLYCVLGRPVWRICTNRCEPQTWLSPKPISRVRFEVVFSILRSFVALIGCNKGVHALKRHSYASKSGTVMLRVTATHVAWSET